MLPRAQGTRGPSNLLGGRRSSCTRLLGEWLGSFLVALTRICRTWRVSQYHQKEQSARRLNSSSKPESVTEVSFVGPTPPLPRNPVRLPRLTCPRKTSGQRGRLDWTSSSPRLRRSSFGAGLGGCCSAPLRMRASRSGGLPGCSWKCQLPSLPCPGKRRVLCGKGCKR